MVTSMILLTGSYNTFNMNNKKSYYHQNFLLPYRSNNIDKARIEIIFLAII